MYFDMVLNELTILISFTDYHNGDILRILHYHQYFIAQNTSKYAMYFSTLNRYKYPTDQESRFFYNFCNKYQIHQLHQQNKQIIIYFLSEMITYEFLNQITTQFLHPTAPFSLWQFFLRFISISEYLYIVYNISNQTVLYTTENIFDTSLYILYLLR